MSNNLALSNNINQENDFDSFIKISPDLLDNQYGILNINGKYILKRENEDNVLLYIKKTMELLLTKAEKVVVYAYLDGYKTKNIRLNFVRKITHVLQNEYPDILYKCYIINAPSYFNIVYKIVSLILDKETKAKIEFQNCNFKESDDQIDIDELTKLESIN